MTAFGTFSKVRADLEMRLAVLTWQFTLKELRFQRATISPERLGEKIMLDITIREAERRIDALQASCHPAQAKPSH